MVVLKILSGRMAGQERATSQFPFSIGRSRSCSLPVEDPGVWEKHAELTMDGSKRFVLRVFPHALAMVNGGSAQHVQLRNGDLIELGGLKLQFWLSASRQKKLTLLEGLVWTIMVAVLFAEVLIIAGLMR